jgi:hypothetical protein
MAEWIYFIHPPRDNFAGGFARGELRPFRISLLRGRDDGHEVPDAP